MRHSILLGFFSLFVLICLQSPNAVSETKRTRIVFVDMGEHVLVEWTLTSSKAEYQFYGSSALSEARADDWNVTSDEFSFDGNTIRRIDGQPFGSFAFKVMTDSRPARGGNQSATLFPDIGWLITTSHFQIKGEPLELVVSGSVENEDHYWSEPRNSQSEYENRQLFISKQPISYSDGLTVLSSSSIKSGALVEELTEKAVGAFDLFGARFPSLENRKPLLLLSIEDDADSQFVKGAVSGDFISFQVSGYSNDDLTSHKTAEISKTLVHELFHLWDSALTASDGSRKNAWLYEGGAEYVATRISFTAPDEIARRSEKALNDCILAIGPRSFTSSRSASRGRVPYNCGFFIHLIAEKALTASRDFNTLDLWSRILERASATEGYTLSDYRDDLSSLGGDEGLDLIDLLEGGLNEENAEEFVQRLEVVGIAMTPDISSADTSGGLSENVSVFRGLFGGMCPNGYSLGLTEDSVLFSSSGACPTETYTDLVISKLNGLDALGEAADLLVEIKRACSEDQSLILTNTANESVFTLNCPSVYRAHPGLFDLLDVGEFVPLARNQLIGSTSLIQ